MKTALITGASRGIGRATALLLAQSGHFDCIAITCRKNKSQLHQTAEEIRKAGLSCLEFCGDMGDYSFAASMTEALLSQTGQLDLLVNNAAISYVGLLTDMSPEEWSLSVSTNLNSVFNTCRLLVPAMVHEKAGRIINVSSVWGLVGASCEVCYSATKGAVNSFTKALAKELAPSNIAVNAVAFGAVDTEMNGHLTAEDQSALCEEIPLGRMITPEEAAQVILKIYEMPVCFTGEVVKADGGWI
jgi:3-oxoacyl-[acyl-carrier protein] reductase